MKTFVINLANRPDRWKPWKNLPVERWEGWDGHEQLPPDWFLPEHDRRRGAWGCLQSHIGIWEWLAKSREKQLLVLEDDCGIDPDFWDRVERFEPPDDWTMWYPGGNIRWQLWRKARFIRHRGPKLIRDGVLRAYAVDRTHAYVIRRSCAIRLASLVRKHLDGARSVHHVDWWLNQWEHGEGTTYAPDRWMCGQLPYYSDIVNNFVGGNRWELEDWRFHAALIPTTERAANWVRDAFVCMEGPFDASKAEGLLRSIEGPIGVITPHVHAAYDWFVNPVYVEEPECRRAIRTIERGRTT